MTPIRGALILAAVLAVLTGLYRYTDSANGNKAGIF